MKKHIAVVMGGTTSEHAISLKSGKTVISHLSKEHFDVTKVVVSPEGYLVHLGEKKIPIELTTFSFEHEGKKIFFDAVFNAIHGAPGENGELQNILDKAKIPYTGCTAEVARLTYNKHRTLTFLEPHGIAMAKHILLNKNVDWNTDEIIEKIGLPCFVKANKAGSSYGVLKVHKASEMQKAIETALLEDDQVLVERFLSGKEVSIGVIEFRGEVMVLPPTEIISNGDFFDYQAKYEGNSQEITPARLTTTQLEKLEKAAKNVFVSLGARGFSRSDFIFQEDTPYFLELNSIPGLTEESLLPKQASFAGIALSELFADMIYSCLKNNTFGA